MGWGSTGGLQQGKGRLAAAPAQKRRSPRPPARVPALPPQKHGAGGEYGRVLRAK
ncbi:hypothetical protein Z950_3022 [Sulfitobacter mediterraneus KCTC 32188]|nr:hypothetical protein Z950_3022 [Sulfitobacter mediterraneus KCTC 32188]